MKDLLFSERLAACLRMKLPSSPSVEQRNGATGDDQGSPSPADNDATASTSTSQTVEQESVKMEIICDHCGTGVHKEEEEQPSDADVENEKKKDWMLAAAVLDRIFAIAFAIIFCGGTFIFFMLFYLHE